MMTPSSPSRWSRLAEQGFGSGDLEQWMIEILLLGKSDDFEALIQVLDDCDDFPGELRSGIESLYHFRSHYAKGGTDLSEEERARILKMDADWTMQLLHSLQEYRDERRSRSA